MVEASRRHGPFETRWPCRRTSPMAARLSLVPKGSPSAATVTDLEEAGAERLLAAVAELHSGEGGRLYQLSDRRQGGQSG